MFLYVPQKRLEEKGLLSGRLKQEVDLITMVSVDEPMSWMKEAVIAFLNVLVKWQSQIEKALEDCGINIKISEEGNAFYTIQNFNFITRYCRAVEAHHQSQHTVESN
jgi:hypothetical protein